jgi:hypothetical protein
MLDEAVHPTSVSVELSFALSVLPASVFHSGELNNTAH